jgi:SAM-dependent methyltransferase
MNPIARWVHDASLRARAARAELFRRRFVIDANTTILDLGSETGANIHAVLQGTQARPQNVYIADIDARAVATGVERYGFNPVVIGESGSLPFPDQYFGIVYCSSVIEHVTVGKDQVWRIRDGRTFKSLARAHQRAFAAEIRRLGQQYFVQTPNIGFPIESHSWLPMMGYLPRRVQVPALGVTNRFWVKRTAPDWCLFNRRELAALFPEAEIVDEVSMGLTKSLMAVRSFTGVSQANVGPTRVGLGHVGLDQGAGTGDGRPSGRSIPSGRERRAAQ